MDKIKVPSSKRTLLHGLLWVVTYLSCLIIVKEFDPSKAVGIVLSFLPIIPFSFFIYNFVKGVLAMDEVEIRIQMEAAIWAFTLGLLLLMTLGLLDLVVVLNKEDWGYRHLVPYFFIFYLFGLIITKRKYNSR